MTEEKKDESEIPQELESQDDSYIVENEEDDESEKEELTHLEELEEKEEKSKKIEEKVDTDIVKEITSFEKETEEESLIFESSDHEETLSEEPFDEIIEESEKLKSETPEVGGVEEIEEEIDDLVSEDEQETEIQRTGQFILDEEDELGQDTIQTEFDEESDESEELIMADSEEPPTTEYIDEKEVVEEEALEKTTKEESDEEIISKPTEERLEIPIPATFDESKTETEEPVEKAEKAIDEAEEAIEEVEEPVEEAEEAITEVEDSVEEVEEAIEDVEEAIEEIEEPMEAAVESEEVEELEEEATFEPMEKKVKKKRPLFLIGLLIGLFVAILTETLFSISLWNIGTSRPDLYYIELVLILVAFMIPGLLSRNFLKGLFGAAIIFAVIFTLPFITPFLGWELLNPLTPLYSSTDFALDAFEVFQSLLPEFQFNLSSIQTWVVFVDLLLMFVLMVLVVTFSTFLLKTITLPKKKWGKWIGIPLLSIGLIIFAIIVPVFYSSTYGIINASTAFLAGSSEYYNAFGTFEQNQGPLSTQELDEVEGYLRNASYWFNVSDYNYQGLRNIGVITIAAQLSGEYGPLIEAGDELALAMLAFTGIISPLFSGINGIVGSLNNATEDMITFGGSEGTTFQKTTTTGFHNKQKNITNLKESVQTAIDNIELAQEALNTIQDQYQGADLNQSFINIEEQLNKIKLDKINPKIADIIVEIKSYLGTFQEQLIGFDDFINFGKTSLEPTKNILWTSYYTIVGNEYIRNYRFYEAAYAFKNATEYVDLISLENYTVSSELGEAFSIKITQNYSEVLNDLKKLMESVLTQEYYFASSLFHLDTMFLKFNAVNYNISELDYGTDILPQQAIDNATESAAIASQAQAETDSFRAKLANDTYGNFFNGIGTNFEQIITQDFQPQIYGTTLSDLIIATDFVIQSFSNYANQDFGTSYDRIFSANSTMTIILSEIDSETADYYRNYLFFWSGAINNLTQTINAYDSGTLWQDGLVEIGLILEELELLTAEKMI
ncbi:MAG: hypothetical protein U9O98_06830 [Asgard group archaeon]|nr:hypothetical protein [Asgard group archaeon]